MAESSFFSFFPRLSHHFSWKYLGIILAVYGVVQGCGEGWFPLFQRYYFKDSLQLTASQAQMMSAVARTPWNIKVSLSVCLTLSLSVSISLSFSLCLCLTCVSAYLWYSSGLFPNIWISSNILHCNRCCDWYNVLGISFTVRFINSTLCLGHVPWESFHCLS